MVDRAAQSLRVLMTTSVFPRWAEDSTPPFVLRQAEAVAAQGWQVTVLAPHCAGAATRERMGDVEVVRFRYMWPETMQGLFYDGGMLVQLRNHPRRKWQLPFMLLAQIRATRKLCDAKSFDLIHAHSLLPQGYTALLSGRLPVVATSHGNDVFGLKETGLYGRLKRKVVSRASAITANSSATEEALRRLGAPAGRIHRVPASPNIAAPDEDDVRRIKARYQKGAKLILFAGRLIEEKGVGDLIAAFAKLDMPEARLLVAGDGAERARFETLAGELGAADRVEFLGWQSRQALANYLAASDVFVGPSKPTVGGWVEAQGLVFVEAMAAGRPIVATDCGGIRDMIVDGLTGLLVEPGNSAMIRDAMRRILTNPELSAKVVANALSYYRECFSVEATIGKLLDVYHFAVNEGAR